MSDKEIASDADNLAKQIIEEHDVLPPANKLKNRPDTGADAPPSKGSLKERPASKPAGKGNSKPR